MLDRALLRLPGEIRGYLRAAAWPAIGSCELCDDETPPDKLAGKSAGKPTGTQPGKPDGKLDAPQAGSQASSQVVAQAAPQAGAQATRRTAPTRLKS